MINKTSGLVRLSEHCGRPSVAEGGCRGAGNSPSPQVGPVPQSEVLVWIARYYQRFLIAAEVIADSTAIATAVIAAPLILPAGQAGLSFIQTTPLTALVIAILGIAIFERLGLYRQQVSLMNLIEIRKIIRAVFFLYLLLVVHLYFLGKGYPDETLGSAAILTLVFTLIERMAFFKLLQYLHLQGFNVRHILIVGAGEEGRLLCQSLHQSPKLGYRVAAFIDEDRQQLAKARDLFGGGRSGRDRLFCDNAALVDKIVDSLEIDEIFISNPLYGDTVYDLIKLTNLGREKQIKIHFLPILRGYSTGQVEIDNINGIPIVSYRALPVSTADQISKRLFDLGLVLLFLPLLLPLCAGIALMIRWDSKGPVFFRQERVGKDGVRFAMYKFRSMHAETPSYGKSPQSSADPRITRLGGFLRKTSLDELPQIINVIRGEMSLVGPRPEMPFIVDNEYTDLHHQRHRVKPGITGVWQISADRTREIHENISYDLFYVENRSLLLDIIILVRTVIFALISMRTY